MMNQSKARTGQPARCRLGLLQRCAGRMLAAAALFASGLQCVQAQEAPPATVADVASPASGAARAAALLDKLPLDFIENRGQWADTVKFAARRGALGASFERDAIRLQLGADRSASLRLAFEGAAPRTSLVGEERRAGRYNFFVGADPAQWQSDVAAYRSVRYRGLYDGIDLRVAELAGQLEYELLLAPGAQLDQAVIRADSALRLELADDGALLVHTAAGALRQTPPLTWEELPGGAKRPIASAFRIIDAQRYGFEVPGRDPALALVIDPGLEWSTFIGGSNREEIHGLALARDGSGDVVVAGHTWSADFPTAPAGSLGASPLIPFVARLNASGTALVYATLFGGTNGNVSFAFGLTLDASSAPIVVGETNAANFPTTAGAYQPGFNEPSATINRGWDGFVTRFNASGSQMLFSTFLGAAPILDNSRPGSTRGGDESARAVVVDASDSVIVAGYTTSENFPTTAGAYDRTHSSLSVAVNIGTIESRTDAFIARLSPNGSQLTYSTYLGGQSDDIVRDMVIDAQGVLTLVGIAAPLETVDGQGNRVDHGTPFPTTADAVTRTHLGASDAFVARLRLDGAGAADLKYATLFGASFIDEITGVALDPNNPELVTVAGHSRSWDFPTTAGAWKRVPFFLADGVPYYSGFLARFRFPAAGAGSLVWSTLVGGTDTGQFADSVVVDPSGDVIVVGTDIAGSYPTTERSYQRLPAKGFFVSRFSGDGKTLLYSTLLGKPSGVLVLRTKAVSSGPRAVVIAGSTLFPDHPTTAGAFDRVFGSNGTSDQFHTYDGFVAKLTLEPGTSADTTAAAPTLLSPADGATIALNGALNFDWSDVADPSGVQFYQVAVSANADFLSGFSWFQLGAGTYTVSQSLGSASQEGVHYWRVRTLDGANNFSPWSAVRRFTVGAPTWTNFAATSLTPDGAIGGSTVLGKVHIQNTARAGGQVYTLTSSKPAVASVPASVTIPAGASSATYTVTTHNVALSTPVMITVWSEGNGDHPVLWVDPATPGAVTLTSLALSPTSVTGGSASAATVFLGNPAPAGGAVVALSADSAAAAVPPNVTVPAGATSAGFTVTTSSVTVSTSVTVSAVFGGVTRSAALSVNPATAPTPTAPTLVSPANDATPAQPVTLDWSDVANAASYEVQVDTSSTIAAPFTANPSVTASTVSLSGLPAQRLWWRVRARNAAGVAGPFSATRRFTPLAAPAAASLSAVTVNPTSVVGGNASAGTVTLTAAAPSGGAVVALSSSHAAASVPASVTVVAGATSAGFTVSTSAVGASTSVTLTGTYSGLSRTTTLTVTPVPPPASLNTLALNPTSVTGGSSSTGTVTLTSAAPSGGAVVALSSNAVAAAVPASVTVAAGATSATFTATTSAVTAATTATISAALAGVTRTAGLTVNPPGTNVTLTVTASGRSGERLSSNPVGIDVAVGSTASASFASGTSITLSVSNGRDAIWSGACSSGGNKARTCTFTLAGSASVTGNVQ